MRWLIAALCIAIALCAAAWRASNRPRADDAAASLEASAPRHALESSIDPPSLAGSNAPRLPLDARGHLLKARDVRDFFDYCLSAQSDLTPASLDTFVAHQIAAQLDGAPAQSEALDVWQRYRAYLAALAQVQAADAKPDFSALRSAMAQREMLAQRTLGDWSVAFFGDEFARTRTDFARLEIMQDASLSDTQKAQRLDALDETLPQEEREARAANAHQQDAIERIAQAQRADASPEEMRAALAQTLGADAAERVAQIRRDDIAWQAKYDAYAAQRAQIGDAADRETRIARLREAFFSAPGEAARAASFDAD